MSIGYDSGSKVWDDYREASWELRRCHFNSLGWDGYVEDLRKEEEEDARFFKGTYETEGSQKYWNKHIPEMIEYTDWSAYYECSPKKIFKKWGFNPKFEISSGQDDGALAPIDAPKKYNKKSADKITEFNPKTDTLEIDADSFGLDGSSATYNAGKNKRKVKKNLARQDFDFLYDQKMGWLYFNENGSGKGFGDGGIIAILKGAPALTMEHIEFL